MRQCAECGKYFKDGLVSNESSFYYCTPKCYHSATGYYWGTRSGVVEFHDDGPFNILTIVPRDYESRDKYHVFFVHPIELYSYLSHKELGYNYTIRYFARILTSNTIDAIAHVTDVIQPLFAERISTTIAYESSSDSFLRNLDQYLPYLLEIPPQFTWHTFKEYVAKHKSKLFIDLKKEDH